MLVVIDVVVKFKAKANATAENMIRMPIISIIVFTRFLKLVSHERHEFWHIKTCFGIDRLEEGVGYQSRNLVSPFS